MYIIVFIVAQSRDYLAMLIEQGLIEFKTTSKGLHILQLQNEINGV